MSYNDSVAYAKMMGGKLLTRKKAQAFIQSLNGAALYPGEDLWVAVKGRDWIQVGNLSHYPGKSHLEYEYPPWGDNPNDQTYGNPTWNYVVLYTDAKPKKLAASKRN